MNQRTTPGSSTIPDSTEMFHRIMIKIPNSKDHHLQEEVWSTFRKLDVLRGNAMHMRAKDGVVTLSGLVGTTAQKAATGKAAASVSGLKKVINAIHVCPIPFQTKQNTVGKAGQGEEFKW